MTFSLRKTFFVFLCVFAAVLMLATTVAAVSYKLGDADGDCEVTILDATCIQRHLAMLPVSGEFSQQAADVDLSGEVEITDATFIQRWLAEIPTSYSIGTDIEDPTEAPSELPTSPSTQAKTQRPTDADGWIRDIFRP